MASILNIPLPLEVWEIIFSYLKTNDIINFCRCSPEYGLFLKRKSVVSRFDVSCNYDFFDINLGDYIKTNVSYEFIKTLNINKLYWIKLDQLRQLVKSLPNLEELLALNTELSLRPKDILLYSKLKTLAISIEGAHLLDPVDPVIYRNNLYLLRKLCLHVTRKHPSFLFGSHRLFVELFALQELWIYDSDSGYPHPIKYDTLVAQLKFLNKLVIKSRVNIPFLDYKPFGLAKYFEIRRFKSISMRYERFPLEDIVPFKEVSIFEPYRTKLEKAWQVFRVYRSEMPYNPLAHREIYLTRDISNVKFDELNFFHNKCFCTDDYIKATWEFLKSKNSEDIRKLSIKSCVLLRENFQKRKNLTYPIATKGFHPIVNIIENCRKITTLELMQCPSCNVTIVDSYPLICKWENLENFTLEVPSHLRGEFLIDLMKTCKKLKFIRIISGSTNEYLNKHIYRALPYANQLQDFCYENKSINVPRMFESLNEIPTRKIRRIFLNCDYNSNTSLKSLENFLGANLQLVFLFLAINQDTKAYMKNVQECMNKFKKNNRNKLFFAKKEARSFIKNHYVCDANAELLNCDTEVATIDIFDFR